MLLMAHVDQRGHRMTTKSRKFNYLFAFDSKQNVYHVIFSLSLLHMPIPTALKIEKKMFQFVNIAAGGGSSKSMDNFKVA